MLFRSRVRNDYLGALEETGIKELYRNRFQYIYSPPREALYDLDTLSRSAGVHPDLIADYVDLGLIEPVDERGEHEWLFDDDALFVLRRIERLRRDLGINLEGVGVILELLHQIEDLRQELERMRKE